MDEEFDLVEDDDLEDEEYPEYFEDDDDLEDPYYDYEVGMTDIDLYDIEYDRY